MLGTIRLGRTELLATRVAMGCIPIQRLAMDDAVRLIHKAYEAGVNFFDTAHVYTDSEEKLGKAFADGYRQNVILASKTMSEDYQTAMAQIDLSLERLKTDFIDIYQWHNPINIDHMDDETSPYRALVDAKEAGKIRFIGITSHHLGRARQAAETGMFDTMQFPMSVLSSREEIALAELCKRLDVGFIAMKAMCGGLLADGRLPFVFLNQFDNVVPIWGLEKAEELDQFLHLAANPEPFTEEMRREADRLRREYGDDFCRGCGYCLPCPAGINLPIMMRIVTLTKRTGLGSQFTPERLAEAERIDSCTECRQCVKRCPYHLDCPDVLKKQRQGFYELYEAYKR